MSSPERSHHRETWLQILLPVTLGGLLLLAAGVYTAAGGGDVSRLADLALIGLLLPCLVLGWLPLGLLIAAVVGMHRLLRLLPAPMVQVRWAVRRATDQLVRLADRVAAPWIAFEGQRAAWRQLFRRWRRG